MKADWTEKLVAEMTHKPPLAWQPTAEGGLIVIFKDGSKQIYTLAAIHAFHQQKHSTQKKADAGGAQ